MPWGWECRAKLIKQQQLKPTERRGEPQMGLTPAPCDYEPPKLFCGPGFDRIKRAPAYTFGHVTKLGIPKPNTTPKAKMLDIRNHINKGGQARITHCVVSPLIEPVTDNTRNPGPGVYKPPLSIRYKKPPAYSIRRVAKPQFQPSDMWTPPPNMYHPPIPSKNDPAYTLGYRAREFKDTQMPGPGEHDPNFNYVKKNKPAYSFGYPFKAIKPPTAPPPNAYCDKKFMLPKRTSPAPSFGIRHSPYLGEQVPYIKPSKLKLALNG